MTTQAALEAIGLGIGQRIKAAGGGMVLGDRITYTSSQTVNRSTWVALATAAGLELAGVLVRACAAGGGGGWNEVIYEGGWGGEWDEQFFTYEELGTSVVLTIGAAGQGATASTAATTGGDTSFGGLLKVYGGKGAGTTVTARVKPSRAIMVNEHTTYTQWWGMGGADSTNGWGSLGNYGGGGGGRPPYSGFVVTGGQVRGNVSALQATSVSSAKVFLSPAYNGAGPVTTEGATGHAGVGDGPGGGGNPCMGGGPGGDGGFPGGGGGWGNTTRAGNGGAGVIYVYPIFRKVLP